MNPQLSTLPPQPSISLHIERLVVDAPIAGSVGPEMLQALVAGELVRLLRENGPPAVGEAAAARRSGGSIRVAAPNTPSQLGCQIAQATYNALDASELAGSAAEPFRGTR